MKSGCIFLFCFCFSLCLYLYLSYSSYNSQDDLSEPKISQMNITEDDQKNPREDGQKEAKIFHKFMRTKRNTGVLLITPVSGLGDRLRSIVIGYYLSYLFQKKFVLSQAVSDEFIEPNFQGYQPFKENDDQIEILSDSQVFKEITDPQILKEMDWRTPNVSPEESIYSISSSQSIRGISRNISLMKQAKVLDLSVRCIDCLKTIFKECEKATLLGHYFPNLKYLKRISQNGHAWQFALKNLFNPSKTVKDSLDLIKQEYYTISNPMVVDYLRNEDILYERFNLEYRRETRSKIEKKILLNDTDLELEFFTFSIQYRSGDTFFGGTLRKVSRFMQEKDVHYFVDKFLEEWKKILIEREIQNESERKIELKMEGESNMTNSDNEKAYIKRKENKRLVPMIFITGDDPTAIHNLFLKFLRLHIPTFTSEEFGEIAHIEQIDKAQTRTYLDWWLLAQSNHILASQSGFPISAAKMECVAISIYFNPPSDFDKEQLKYTPRFMEFDRKTGLCGNEKTSLFGAHLFSYIDEKRLVKEVERRVANNIRSLSVQYTEVFKKFEL